MSDYALSPQQLAVICALSTGATVAAAAAEQAGIHRNTISNWRRNQLPFQHALAHAQYDRALYFREKLEDLVDLAIQSLQQILTDPNAPPSVRLKAALAIIATASAAPAPLLPQSVHNHAQTKPEPADAAEPELSATEPIVHNSAQGDRSRNKPPAQPSKIPHKNAQSPRCVPPQTGRNQPCPCQSGKKYKRCCLDKKPAIRPEFLQRMMSAA